MPSVKDAVLIRTAHFETLAERLLEIPNEPNENENLFSFLSRRAPLPFLKRLIELEPEPLHRRGRSGLWHKIAWRAEYRAFAQAHSMLLLPEDVRSRSRVDLERAALKDWDISFFPSEEILSLFRPHELIALIVKILDILNNHISQEITDIEEDVDLDFDIEDQFLKVTSFIKNAEVLAINDEDLKQHLRQLSYDARVAISACERRQSEDQGTSVFFDMPTAEAPSSRGQRSTFSDIDED